MSRTVASLLVAALVMLAGCAGGIAGQNPSGAQTQSADSGTVNFYVSDEKNAIEDFEHLNVTISKIGFQTAGDAEADAEAEGDAETDGDENETTTVENTTTDASENETSTTQASEADEEEDETEESERDEEESDEEDDSGDGEWIERQVDSRTVDLTTLQGANATMLGNITVPSGEYEQVFVHVSDVNGTLKTGEQVNVKLPSQKLQLKKGFTVSSSNDVDFVFDITVFKAGNSGKYILKPVASESGTDVEIDDVDEREDDEDEVELEASVVGDAEAGEEATVKVTRNDQPVENATLRLNGEVVATTGADGTATVQLPADVEEVEIEATTEGESEGEAELELEFGEDDESDEQDDSDENDTAENGEVELGAVLEGTFAAGENVTVYVTDGDGEAVEDATVAVDGEVVGETNAEGELAFVVPDDVSMDSDITITADGDSVTLDAGTVAAAN
jgi:cold shock CspA family protein